MVSPPPLDFLCPITKQLMTDPVSSLHGGKSFERTAILKWLDSGKSYCPISGIPLTTGSLESNKALQWKIRYWKMKNGSDSSEQYDDHEDTYQRETFKASAPLQERFLCPLTKKVMKDPVMSCYGYNFDRVSIMKWIVMRGEVCPISHKPLKISDLVANTKLEWEIRKWEQELFDENSGKGSTATALLQARTNVDDCSRRDFPESREINSDSANDVNVQKINKHPHVARNHFNQSTCPWKTMGRLDIFSHAERTGREIGIVDQFNPAGLVDVLKEVETTLKKKSAS